MFDNQFIRCAFVCASVVYGVFSHAWAQSPIQVIDAKSLKTQAPPVNGSQGIQSFGPHLSHFQEASTQAAKLYLDGARVRSYVGRIQARQVGSQGDVEGIRQYLQSERQSYVQSSDLEVDFKPLAQVHSEREPAFSRYQVTHSKIPVFASQVVVVQDEDGAIGEVHLSPLKLNITQSQFNDFYSLDPHWRVGLPHLSYDIVDVEAVWFAGQMFDSDYGDEVLAGYEFLVRSRQDQEPFLFRFVINALNGDILYRENRLIHAKDRRVQASSGTIYRSEGSSPSGIADADSAYDFSGYFYDMLTSLGRDSYDDAGATMISNINVSGSCPNAWWDEIATSYCAGMATRDIVVHEFTHALTTHTADLIYSGESGALNESFSDLFGVSSDSNWTMGEGSSIGIIRDVSDPGLYNQPDHYDDFINGGGVHTNSGVHNKMGYLLINGGSHGGVTVQGIGFEDALSIFYHELLRLTPSSTMSDASVAAILAAEALFGAGSQQVQSTQDAFAAIGLYVDPNPNLSLSLDTLDFGGLYQGFPDTTSIHLSNIGIQQLEIGIEIIGAQFETLIDTIVITGESDSLFQIIGLANTLGTHAGMILFHSNDPDSPTDTLHLSSEVGVPPEYTLDQSHLVDTILSGQQDTLYSKIHNTGGLPLELSFSKAQQQLLINEFSNASEYIELINVGNAKDLGGYTLEWVDNNYGANSFTFPAGVSIRENSVLVLREGSGVNNDSNLYMNQYLTWYSSTSISMLLKDSNGVEVDAFLLGTSTTNSTTWQGSEITNTGHSYYQRQSLNDQDLASDWLASSYGSPGLLNTQQDFSSNLSEGLVQMWVQDTVVAAGDSILIPIELNSNNVFGGEYMDTIYVDHNSPSQASPLLLTLNTTVIGAPSINHIDSLQFSTTWNGSSVQEDIWLYNSGTDTTFITGWTSTLGLFSVVDSVNSILPQDSALVRFQFTPASTGDYSAEIQFTTNVASKTNATIYLSGSSAVPPEIEWNPTFLSDSLNAYDTLMTGAWMKNIGGSTLLFNSGSLLISEVSSSPNGIELVNLSPQDISLDGYSLEWLSQYGSPLTYTFDSTAIIKKDNEYVLGENYYIPTTDSSSTWSSYMYWDQYDSLKVILRDASGDILDVFINSRYTHTVGQGHWNGAGVNGNYYSYHRVSIWDTDQQGDWSNLNSSNLGTSVLSGSSSDWWEVISPLSSIAPGDSLWVDVKMMTNHQASGFYFDTLSFATNLPDTMTHLPLQLKVLSNVEISFSQDSLDFGSLFTDLSYLDTIVVYNRGNGELNISAFQGVSSAFSIITTLPQTLARGDSLLVVIQAQASTAQDIDEVWQVYSNANSNNPFAIQVNAQFRSGPQLVDETLTWTLDVAAGTIDSLDYQFSNPGDQDLEMNYYWRQGMLASPATLPQSVLVLEDHLQTHYYTQALTSLGWGYETTPHLDSLKSKLSEAGDWDFIIINTLSNVDSTLFDLLETHQGQGSQVILFAGDMHSYRYHSYLSQVGVTSLYTNTYPDYIRLNGHPALSGGVNQIDTLIYTTDNSYINGYDYNYNYQLAQGHGFLGSSYNPAFVSSLDRQVILPAFFTGDFLEDGDSDGKFDMLELVENTLTWALRSKTVSSSMTDVLSAGNTLSSSIRIDASQLLAGQYLDTLIIQTNEASDSLHQFVLVVNVQGEPEIQLADTLQLDSLWLGLEDTSWIEISNPGTDTLVLDSTVVSNLASLSMTITDSVIPPQQSRFAQLVVTPDLLGIQAETMVIHADSLSDTLVVQWTTLTAPRIVLSEDQFQVTLSPGDSTLMSVNVSNPGGDSLVWSSAGISQGLIISEVSSNPDYIEIHNLGHHTIDLTGYTLDWVDNTGSSNTYTFSSGDIQAGATLALVEFSGTDNDSVKYIGLSMGWGTNSEVAVNLLDDQSQSIDYFNGFAGLAIPAGAQWEGPYLDRAATTHQRNSRVDTDSLSDWTGASLASLGHVPEMLDEEGSTHLSLAPTEGVLFAGEDQDLDLTIYSFNRLAGVYLDTIWIQTNLNDQLVPIEVQSTIESSTTLETSVDTIVMDTIFVGDTNSFDLTLFNLGNDQIIISSILYDSAQFNVTSAGSIEPFSSIPLSGDWIPLDTGVQEQTIYVVSDADSNSMKAIVLQAEVRMGPVLEVVSNVTVYQLEPGDSTTNVVQLTNSGDQDLIYNLSTSTGDNQYNIYTSETGAIPYQWEDISSTGTLANSCDDCSTLINLTHFEFPFYDSTFTRAYVSSNGMVNFSSSNTRTGGSTYPSSSNPAYSVAAYWRDLHTSPTAPGNGLFYQEFDDRLVVQFEHVRFLSGADTVTYQYIFHKNGRIMINYESLTTTASPAGFQKSGIDGVNLASYMGNMRSIEIRPSGGWMIADVAQDTLTPGEGRSVNLDIHAELDMPLGQYDALLSIDVPSRPNQSLSQAHTLNVVADTDSMIVSLSASGPGTISPIGDIQVGQGDSLEFQIYPNPGVYDYILTINGVETPTTQDNYTLYQVEANTSVHVEFLLPVGVTELATLFADWAQDPGQRRSLYVYRVNGHSEELEGVTYTEFKAFTEKQGAQVQYVKEKDAYGTQTELNIQ